jgi:hypothetical protein
MNAQNFRRHFIFKPQQGANVISVMVNYWGIVKYYVARRHTEFLNPAYTMFISSLQES